MRFTLFPEPPLLAAAADSAGILLFAVVGVLSHESGVSATALGRDALPLLAGWFAAGAAFALYRRPSRRALLSTWLVGIPVGVAVRALVLGRVTEPRELAFLATTLVISLAFVSALRGLAAVARTTRARSVEQ